MFGEGVQPTVDVAGRKEPTRVRTAACFHEKHPASWRESRPAVKGQLLRSVTDTETILIIMISRNAHTVTVSHTVSIAQ
jgi:hypothetical protein